MKPRKITDPKDHAAPKKPGVRVDGGKRRDLNENRVVARMAGVLAGVASEEQIKSRRQRDQMRDRIEKRAAAQRQDGSVVSTVQLRVSGRRTTLQAIRCRPGSFEWRYGRKKQDALFHAGSQFARLWEQAGISIASSANFLRGTSAGFTVGVSESRLHALDKLRSVVDKLGHAPTERLIAYCVNGETTSEMARRHGVADRDMGTVLTLDLKACAAAMNYRAP